MFADDNDDDGYFGRYPKPKDLVGRTVKALYANEETFTFETDQGLVTYRVEGDCCSHSYFFDIFGVRHLLDNGPVTAYEEITLSPGDPGYRPETWEAKEDSYESIAVYGFRITTEHPMFGPVSTVLSFRNSSNGYYGGMMYRESPETDLRLRQSPITEDCASIESLTSTVVSGDLAAPEITAALSPKPSVVFTVDQEAYDQFVAALDADTLNRFQALAARSTLFTEETR